MAIWNITPAQKAAIDDWVSKAQTYIDARKELWKKLPDEMKRGYLADSSSCPDYGVKRLIQVYLYLDEHLGGYK